MSKIFSEDIVKCLVNILKILYYSNIQLIFSEKYFVFKIKPICLYNLKKRNPQLGRTAWLLCYPTYLSLIKASTLTHGNRLSISLIFSKKAIGR